VNILDRAPGLVGSVALGHSFQMADDTTDASSIIGTGSKNGVLGWDKHHP